MGHMMAGKSGLCRHHVFEAAARDFGPRFVSDLDDFLDEAVRNL